MVYFHETVCFGPSVSLVMKVSPLSNTFAETVGFIVTCVTITVIVINIKRLGYLYITNLFVYLSIY
jgi:hypothetical protein